MTTILFGALILYGAAGAAIGLAFIVSGVTKVQPMPVSLPARVLLLPGAIALWPLVLARWRKLRRVQ